MARLDETTVRGEDEGCGGRERKREEESRESLGEMEQWKKRKGGRRRRRRRQAREESAGMAREGDARVEKRVVARKRGRTIEGGGEEWREWRAGV